MIKCPLCECFNLNTTAIEQLDIPGKRAFYFCSTCYLIFVSDVGKLNEIDEKERYLLHQNKKEDERYVNFLRYALDPTVPLLNRGMKGLDYGCGHTPVLSLLLREEGYTCDIYDPFFYPYIKKNHYDFIFATEVVEHFFNPGREFRKVDELLLKGGYLTIMTSFWDKLELFTNWYYKNDPAHVAFYHYKTFQAIAAWLNYEIVYTDQRKVIVFRKREF